MMRLEKRKKRTQISTNKKKKKRKIHSSKGIKIHVVLYPSTTKKN